MKSASNVLIFLAAAVLIFSCDRKREILPDFEEIYSFVIDGQGVKYLATDQGLFSFSGEGWKNLTPSEATYSVRDIAISSIKDLWLATDEGVLNFTADTMVKASVDGLLSNDVERLANADPDRFFMATSDGVSVLSDGEWHEVFTETWFDTLPDFKDFNPYAKTGIAVSSDSYTYISTLGGGVGRFRTDVDGISGATLFDNYSWLQSLNVYSIYVHDSVQWYGTDKGVAAHYSWMTKVDWKIINTQYIMTIDGMFENKNGLIGDTVLSITRDGDGSMWFGTTRGLCSYDGNTWKQFSNKNDRVLLSDTVNCLATDPSGRIWIATPRGLSQYTGQEFVHFTLD